MGEAIKLERSSDRVPDALRTAFRAALANVKGSFEQREAAALALGNAIVRQFIEDELQAAANDLADEVIVDGARYRRISEGTGRYHTLCGAVAIRRALYRMVGIHNGPTLVPLELRAGIWENATPALAFSVTQGFATQPPRHYEQEMAAAHRLVPSRSTLERIGKRIGAAISDQIAAMEPCIRLTEPWVEGVCSISFGLDRTTAPMAEVIADAPIPEPRIRQRPAPVMVAYRMVYVGTVSLHDREGNVLATKMFAATPNEGPDELLARIASELIHQQGRYGATISVIQDGAPELWNLVAQLRERHGVAIDAEVLDRYHVDERLAEICEAIFGKYAEAYELYARWRYQLDQSDTAIDRIIRHLDALVFFSRYGFIEGDDPPSFWCERHVITVRDKELRTVEGHLEYLRRHRRLIRYATRKRTGRPIGSGATEGACKSLVAMRCKRGGQRWFESGLGPCLALRALHLSGRLQPAFARIVAARTATLEAA